MAKLNRIRIVLAEHDLNNKWLADKLGKVGKGPGNYFQMGNKYYPAQP